MSKNLIDKTRVIKKPGGTLEEYISTFVENWNERQERVTQNREAKEKAKREWQEEQERLRSEARSRKSLRRPSD